MVELYERALTYGTLLLMCATSTPNVTSQIRQRWCQSSPITSNSQEFDEFRNFSTIKCTAPLQYPSNMSQVIDETSSFPIAIDHVPESPLPCFLHQISWEILVVFHSFIPLKPSIPQILSLPDVLYNSLPVPKLLCIKIGMAEALHLIQHLG